MGKQLAVVRKGLRIWFKAPRAMETGSLKPSQWLFEKTLPQCSQSVSFLCFSLFPFLATAFGPFFTPPLPTLFLFWLCEWSCVCLLDACGQFGEGEMRYLMKDGWSSVRAVRAVRQTLEAGLRIAPWVPLRRYCWLRLAVTPQSFMTLGSGKTSFTWESLTEFINFCLNFSSLSLGTQYEPRWNVFRLAHAKPLWPQAESLSIIPI